MTKHGPVLAALIVLSALTSVPVPMPVGAAVYTVTPFRIESSSNDIVRVVQIIDTDRNVVSNSLVKFEFGLSETVDGPVRVRVEYITDRNVMFARTAYPKAVPTPTNEPTRNE